MVERGPDARRARLDASAAPTRSSDVHAVELDGEAVLLDERGERLHLLNPTGTLVWNLLDGQATLDDLARDLSDEIGLPYEAALADVLGIARHLHEEGLVYDWRRVSQSRWHRHPHVLWRRSLDSVLVLADGLDEPIALTGTGPALWMLLADPRSADDIVDALAAAYDTGPEIVAADVHPLLARLDELGVIAPV